MKREFGMIFYNLNKEDLTILKNISSIEVLERTGWVLIYANYKGWVEASSKCRNLSQEIWQKGILL